MLANVSRSVAPRELSLALGIGLTEWIATDQELV